MNLNSPRQMDETWTAKAHSLMDIVLPNQTDPISITAIISSSLKNECLLGWQDLIKLGIIPKTFPFAPSKHTHIVQAIQSAPASHADRIQSLLDQYTATIFNTEHQPPMKGPPVSINLNKKHEGYQPLKCLTARRYPANLEKEANKYVEDAVKNGIIAPVTTPTEWISPAFFVQKPQGGLRLVTDFSHLSKFVERPVHPFNCTQDVLRGIPASAKIFAKLDAKSGYHQIPLDEHSSMLTTFILPSGRYRYLRSPMGLNASSDHWNLRSDEALKGLPIIKIVDDILIYAPNFEQLYTRIHQVLDRCHTHGITLSRAKFDYGHSILFAGHLVTSDGIKPDPSKLEAIGKFPTPQNITDLRSFMGLAQQLGCFLPDLAHILATLRPLLRKDTQFLWLPDHEEAFRAAKKILTSDALVGYYDLSKPVRLLTDASRLHGLGYCLLQDSDDGQPKIIQCGSRSLLPQENRYSATEIELLAITWAMHHCRHFLYGNPHCTVLTDHRALVGLLQKPLENVHNSRLLRLREKLIEYTFDIQWTNGRTHLIADALSRHPVFKPEEDTAEILQLTISEKLDSDPALKDIISASQNDSTYKSLYKAIKLDIPWTSVILPSCRTSVQECLLRTFPHRLTHLA